MKILVAEDDSVHALLLRRFLSGWGYHAVTCNTGDDALRLLLSPDAPRLALLDWMMPGLDGVDVCRRLRAAGRASYTYVLLLTSKAQKQDVVAGIEAGADDYLVKPFDNAELKARLRSGCRILDLEDQLVAARDALHQLAIRDPLTNLYNRRFMEETLEREWQRAQRRKSQLGIVMVDLDHFKRFNDTYGHDVGDALLRATAQFLVSQVRASDFVCRYGGEEFTLIFPEADLQAVANRMEKIRAGIVTLPEFSGRNVTLSAGVAMYPAHDDHPAGLLKIADQALYRAKSSGRNRVVVAEGVLTA